MSTTIVADSSALIAFLNIGRLAILQSLFGEIVIPPAVVAEVPALPMEPWIRYIQLVLQITRFPTPSALENAKPSRWLSA